MSRKNHKLEIDIDGMTLKEVAYSLLLLGTALDNYNNNGTLENYYEIPENINKSMLSKLSYNTQIIGKGYGYRLIMNIYEVIKIRDNIVGIHINRRLKEKFNDIEKVER